MQRVKIFFRALEMCSKDLQTSFPVVKEIGKVSREVESCTQCQAKDQQPQEREMSLEREMINQRLQVSNKGRSQVVYIHTCSFVNKFSTKKSNGGGAWEYTPWPLYPLVCFATPSVVHGAHHFSKRARSSRMRCVTSKGASITTSQDTEACAK